jgi:hypothetical protein
MHEEETTFHVHTLEISEGRKLYVYTFDDPGQEAVDDENP